METSFLNGSPARAAPFDSDLASRPFAAADDRGAAKICVVYASIGRAEVLKSALTVLEGQTRAPDLVIVSAVSPDDTRGIEAHEGRQILFGSRGLSRQRNRALHAIPGDFDFVVFFDDDFIPHPDWLLVVERCFRQRRNVVAITGHMAIDGIHGPGLSLHDGLAAIADAAGSKDDYCLEGYSPYGCNMAFRASAIRNMRFDERLVLYSWLEDRDFGGALSRRGGTLIKLGTAVGAHLGVKKGRISGRRLGYSQVVNPVYLYRKGTMTSASLLQHLSRNLAANLVRSFAPEPHIDRAGRLRGNLHAIKDLVRGVASPERAEIM